MCECILRQEDLFRRLRVENVCQAFQRLYQLIFAGECLCQNDEPLLAISRNGSTVPHHEGERPTFPFGVNMRHFMLALTVVLVLPATLSAVTFAQLALGGGYECSLIVTNQANQSWQGTAALFSGDRQPWAGPWNLNGVGQVNVSSFPIKLNSKETKKFVLTGDSNARSGYLTIEGQTGFSTLNLALSYFYYYFDGTGKIAFSTGSPPSESGSQFVIPVEKGPTVDTGLAWAGGCASCGSFWLRLFDDQGTQIQEQWVPSEGHVAKFFTEIFDLRTRESFVGSILLDTRGRSSYLTVLRMDYSQSGLLLTSVPAANYIEDTTVPQSMYANGIANGLDLLTGVIARANNNTVFQGEVRAKFVAKSVTTVNLSSDYDFYLGGRGASSGGCQWQYRANKSGRLFFQWRLQNKVGWSVWSTTMYVDTDY